MVMPHVTGFSRLDGFSSSRFVSFDEKKSFSSQGNDVVMEDIRLFRQGWKWVLSRKYLLFLPTLAATRIAAFSDRHWWSLFSRWCLSSGNFLLVLLLRWKASIVNGSASLLRLGPAALLVTLWSSFLSSASLSSLLCLLLILVCYMLYMCPLSPCY